MAARKLTVEIVADASKFKRGMPLAQKSAQSFSGELDGTIPMAVCDLDLSPAAFWTTDPF